MQVEEYDIVVLHERADIILLHLVPVDAEKELLDTIATKWSSGLWPSQEIDKLEKYRMRNGDIYPSFAIRKTHNIIDH
jgi:hypothetical protein